MLAGVDETDGVDGGVFIPPSPRDPFGELLFNGDGMLYLKHKEPHIIVWTAKERAVHIPPVL